MVRARFRQPPVTVATILDPDARIRVETAAGTSFRTVHARSVREARSVLRARSVGALLMSAGSVPDRDLPGLRRLRHDFPGVPLIALASPLGGETPEQLVQLGASGVRTVVDLSRRDGWKRLRDILEASSPIRTRILSALLPRLSDASGPARDFFQVMVWLAPGTPTVRLLAAHLKVVPSTFVSRFFRAGVPSPKQYLAAVRLVHASALFEAPGLSIADVAYRLEYSSPQSFGRHIRACTGSTAGEFRRRYTFDRTVHEFLDRLVVPYRAQLRTFRPL